MIQDRPAVGVLLRDWRQRRRMSQLHLACEAEISQKHLSFVESGRAAPSRDMVLRLAERLDVPLREQNQLLVAAGYAPIFPERPLHDPALRAAREAIDLVLAGHEPHPALAVDRHWRMVAANRCVLPLVGAIADPALLAPPVNVLRLSLHPDGLAPRIVNLAEWRAHILDRLRRQVELTADPELAGLLAELAALPRPSGPPPAVAPGALVVPLRLRIASGVVLSLLGTTTVFGTPVDVTLAELALECFYPADPGTAAALRAMAAAA